MNSLEKKYEIDMCSGSILKKLLLFTLPLMCSSMLQLMFNAADVIVVGRFAGDKSLAAVGANTSLVNLLTNLFVGLSIGANVLASKEYGGNKEDELKKTVHTSIYLSIASGLALTVIGVALAPTFLRIMNTPEKIIGPASVYMRILFLGMPALMIYNFGAALLRSVGDTKRPLNYLLFSGIINVILNLFFVVVLKIDVAGVALATIISQYISALLIIRCLVKEKGGIHLVIKEVRLHKDKFLEIIKVGLPAGFQGVVFALSNVAIQSSINLFGEDVVAGNSAAASIESFVYMGMNAFSQAAISFTGQNMGAGKYKRVDRIIIVTELCVTATGLILGFGVFMSGEILLKIYTSSAAVIHSGMDRISMISTTYALCGIMEVLVGVLRGMGYSIMPMLVSVIGVCGLRLVWLSTVFSLEKFHNIFTVYASYPITWTITIIAHTITFFVVRKKYMTRKKHNEMN